MPICGTVTEIVRGDGVSAMISLRQNDRKLPTTANPLGLRNRACDACREATEKRAAK